MSRLVHVVAPRSTSLSRWLRALPDHHEGALVVAVPPEHQVAVQTFAKATLMGLGKRFDVPGGPGGGTPLAVEMQAWVGASRTCDLIVPEAERLPFAVACEVAALMSAVGVRLWLVEFEPAGHRLDAFLASMSGAEMTLDDFTAHWQEAGSDAAPSASRPRLDAFPAVPQAHGVVFRAECRRRLGEAHFSLVDGLYRDVFALTTKAVADDNRRQHPQRLAILFRGLFRRIPDAGAVVTAARAMQAASLLAGWNVLVDELRLRSAASLDLRDATRPDGEWSKLNAYRRTDLPALCALIASDLTPRQVGLLTLGAVDEAAAVVRVVDADEEICFSVHERARVYLRAHVLGLRLGGNTDDDLLFPGLGTSVKSARERCNMLTRKAALEVGFSGARRLEGRVEVEHVVKQVSRLGITLKSFDRQSSTAPGGTE